MKFTRRTDTTRALSQKTRKMRHMVAACICRNFPGCVVLGERGYVQGPYEYNYVNKPDGRIHYERTGRLYS